MPSLAPRCVILFLACSNFLILLVPRLTNMQIFIKLMECSTHTDLLCDLSWEKFAASSWKYAHTCLTAAAYKGGKLNSFSTAADSKEERLATAAEGAVAVQRGERRFA